MSCKYVFKLIVIGDCSVGKTSIIQRFAENLFVDKKNPTLGVDMTNHVLEINREKINLILWDTAGSEAFRSLTHSYYRAAAGILLIYDITDPKSFENLEFWLDEAKKYVKSNTSIILVGNKNDLWDKRKVPEQNAKIFADKHKIKFIETSAKSSDNIIECFLLISENIYAKIKTGEIDVLDSESGARLTEKYLKGEPEPIKLETMSLEPTKEKEKEFKCQCN